EKLKATGGIVPGHDSGVVDQQLRDRLFVAKLPPKVFSSRKKCHRIGTITWVVSLKQDGRFRAAGGGKAASISGRLPSTLSPTAHFQRLIILTQIRIIGCRIDSELSKMPPGHPFLKWPRPRDPGGRSKQFAA